MGARPSCGELRAFAEETAREAGALLRARFESREGLNESLKSPRNVVTEADLAAERLIRARIEESYPDHAIVGEEYAARDGRGFRWFVDPLDGTTNFAFRVPHWAVSIGVCDEEGEIAGAIFDPMRGEIYSAGRGEGAWQDGRRLAVTRKDDWSQSLVATGFASTRGDEPDYSCLETLRRVLMKVQGIRRMGSAALDFASVAAGRFDLFYEDGLGAWDICAGALLVKEAGGLVLEHGGGTNYLETGHVVAGTPELVKRFLGEMLA